VIYYERDCIIWGLTFPFCSLPCENNTKAGSLGDMLDALGCSFLETDKTKKGIKWNWAHFLVKREIRS